MSVADPVVSPELEERWSPVRLRTLEILTGRRRSRLIRRRGWLVRRALLAADVVGLVVAFFVTQWLFEPSSPVPGPGPAHEALAFALTLPLWVILAKLYGLYDRDEERTDTGIADDVSDVFNLVSVGAWIVYIGLSLSGVGHPSLAKIGCFWAVAIAAISVARGAARNICRNHPSYIQNALIVGAGAVGQEVARKLLQHPEYGINLVGFVDADRATELHPAARRVPVVGGPDELTDLVVLLDVERVIFAFGWTRDSELLPVLGSLADLEVQIDIVPRYFEIIGDNADLHSVEGMPLLALRPPRFSRSSLLLKRMLDLVVSLVALVVLAPLFVAIAVAIKVDSRGPVVFRQVRVGRGQKRFRIWKFRTMVADADARKAEVAHLNKHLKEGGDPRMFKIADDPRVTRVGRLLRRYSLDELPQLVNVLVGQMSLVGPRPLIVDEHAHVHGWKERRLSLKPGITGLWQVLGRDDIPFEDMVKMDYLYVTNWSLRSDLRLILRTPAVVAGARAHGGR
jgi:exopolysaccharide biosynthesis polyprenyl glycosylphosphotransferase